MGQERHYIAVCDDGHDKFEFEFVSTHRADSKENYEDAKRAYRRKHGRRWFEILCTYRID